MKNILLTFSLFYCLAAFSQTNKREYLLDENDKEISQAEFTKKIAPPDYKYTYTITENDTAVIAKTLLRKEYGFLSEADRQQVIDELKALSGKSVDPQQIIIINFFYLEPVKNQVPCIDHYTTDRAYKRFISRRKDVAQFAVTAKGYTYSRNSTVEDKNGFIRDTLFPYEVYCGNYIIIKPDGSFYRQFGEYRQDEIPDKVKAEW